MKNTKTIYFIRHAKSSWENNLEDFDRPLSNRGSVDAALVSKHIKTKFVQPTLILSSGAKRAIATSKIFINNLNLENVNFVVNNDIYDFSGTSLLNVLKSCKNTINTLMIFGHNYAFTNIVNTLGSETIENVATSGFVEIHFKVNCWSLINKGITKRIVFPKHLK